MPIVPASLLLEISQDYVDYRQRREESWYGYVEGNTWGAYPFAASHLYRGQNARYTPMLPSMARGLDSTDLGQLWKSSVSDQAKLVIRVAQSWWFAQELTHHPISTHAKSLHLPLDEIALAQHYGIPTGYLDLTDDFNVSAFFATCRWTPQGWEPIDSGTGVIYRVDLRTEPRQLDQYNPLGPQLLPRPSEQCAWISELPLRHSFEGWPGVSMLQFSHDRKVADHFLAMFAGGDKLFPPDPLANVAEEILASGELPTELADAALNSFANDPHGVRPDKTQAVRRAISELITLTNYRRLLLPEHVCSLLSDEQWRSKMLSNVDVRWRAVRRIPIASLTSPPSD